MENYAVENLSELRLNDGSGNTALTLNDYKISGEGNAQELILDYQNDEWDIENSDLNLNGGELIDVGDLGGSGIVNQDNIADGAVTNSKLNQDSVTYSSGDYLTGGGTVSLGGSATLNVDPSSIDWSDTAMSQSDINVSNLGPADSNLDMNSKVITGLSDPIDGDDAVSKSYVDSTDNDTNLGETEVEQYVFDNDNSEGDLGVGSNNLDSVSGIYSDDSSSNFFGSCSSGEYVESINADGSVNCATDDTGSTVDEKVAVDSGASPSYLGSGGSSGVIRTNSPITYSDNGDYITLDIGTGGISSNELDETDSYSLDWSNLAIDQSDVAKSDVNLGNVRNVDLANTAGSYINYDTTGEEFNVQAGSMSWADLDISKSDVSPSNVGDAGLSTDSSISGSTYDGTTAYTWGVNWEDAGDLNSNGEIEDFSNANDLDSSGNLASGSVSGSEITENSVGNFELENSGNIDLGTLDVSGGSVGDGTQSGLTVDSNGNLYFDGSLNFPGDVNTISAQQLNGSIIPDRDADQNLGSGSSRWNNLYLASNIYDGSGTNFFGSCSGSDSYIHSINSDGTVNCATDNTGNDDQTLSEVLTQDNSAGTEAIDMNGNPIRNVDNVEINGSSALVDFYNENSGQKWEIYTGGSVGSSGLAFYDRTDGNYILEMDSSQNVNIPSGGLTVSGDIDVGGVAGCDSTQALLGDGSCGATSDPTSLTGGDGIDPSSISDGDTLSVAWEDANGLDSNGELNPSTELDLNNNNITDTGRGNVTIGQDLKVYGKVWTPETGDSGSGITGSQNLSQVLTEGNVANQSIDMDNNKIENIANPTASNDAMTLGYADSNYLNRDGSGYMTGNLDLRGNNITDEANGNVTISQDLKVDGNLWLPGEGGSASSTGGNLSKKLDVNQYNITNSSGGNVTIGTDLKVNGDIWQPSSSGSGGSGSASGLADVLNENNSAGGQDITDVGKIGTSGAVEIGSGTSTTGDTEQTAVGNGADASGFAATALGNGAVASSTRTIAVGELADASALDAIALGKGAVASETGVIALGESAVASASRATALGNFANASAEGAVAIGRDSIANHSYTVTLGSLENDAYDLRVTGDIYTNGADLAEFYQSSQDLEAAEVVAIDEGKKNRAVRSSERFQETAFGVVSTDPGQIMNTDEEKNGHPIALEGKVPVKVSEENGEIKIGDRVVPASENGEAMSCEVRSLNETETFDEYKQVSEENRQCRDSTIGKALEKSEGKDKILVKLD